MHEHLPRKVVPNPFRYMGNLKIIATLIVAIDCIHTSFILEVFEANVQSPLKKLENYLNKNLQETRVCAPAHTCTRISGYQ